MAELHVFLEQVSALHNHLCPRQVLGIRMGLYAADLLHLELQREVQMNGQTLCRSCADGGYYQLTEAMIAANHE